MKAIESALRELEKMKETILSYQEAANIAETVVDAHKELKPTVSIGFQQGTLQGVLIHLHVTDMRQVTPVLRKLASLGHPKKGEPEDYAELRRRSWNCGVIQVMAFLPWEEGATCKYVQVGTKEEPVYELRCGEELTA